MVAVLSLLTLIRDQGPPTLANWRVWELLPSWSWQTWGLLLLIVLFVALLEGSWRVHEEERRNKEQQILLSTLFPEPIPRPLPGTVMTMVVAVAVLLIILVAGGLNFYSRHLIRSPTPAPPKTERAGNANNDAERHAKETPSSTHKDSAPKVSDQKGMRSGHPAPPQPDFIAIAERAKKLSIAMEAFMARAKPPYAPQEPSENASWPRAWNKYVADTVAAFNEQFAADLFTLVRDLKDVQLADNQLGRDISYLEQRFPSWLPEDIPTRVGFISEHLVSADERSILQIPLKRRLTPSQVKALKASLTPPFGKLVIEYSTEEPDAKDYASDFSKVLGDAGWKIVKEGPMGNRSSYSAPYTRNGVIVYRDTMGITISEQRQNYAIAQRLSDTLNRIGIWPDRANTNDAESDAVLIVGSAYQ